MSLVTQGSEGIATVPPSNWGSVATLPLHTANTPVTCLAIQLANVCEPLLDVVVSICPSKVCFIFPRFAYSCLNECKHFFEQLLDDE